MKQLKKILLNKINEKQIREIFESEWQEIAIHWFELQMSWLQESFKNFNDHEKFLILIHLVKKTLDQYSENYITLSFKEFYNFEEIEINKFNIIDISKKLEISRETVRRKIYELEKIGAIRKEKKKLIIRSYSFRFQKPEIILKKLVNFLNKFSLLAFKRNIINNELSKEQIESCLLLKFSYCWKIFYETLIPNLVTWKKIFLDIETFHIYGTIFLNQTYETNKYLKNNNLKLSNRIEFLELVKNLKEQTGINAMSISELTGIPRATVIRKLKKLIKKKFIFIDKDKLYHLEGEKISAMTSTHSKIIERISVFTSKILNLVNFN